MKITTLALLSAMTLGVATSTSATIVYQDTFDAADGISTNTGVGGGLISGTNITAADPFDDASGNAVAQTNFGNRVTWAHTANEFDLSPGFTLQVVFTTAATGFPSYTASFGIVDEVTAGTPAANDVGSSGNLNAFLIGEQADLNAVGLQAGPRDPDGTGSLTSFEGVNADLGGTLTQVSTGLNTAINLGTTQTFTLVVATDGSGSATLDSTTVNFAAGTFSALYTNSLDDEFYFAAYSQGNAGLSLDSVTITAVPEPGSLALLGLGGLLIARRRRA